MRLDAHYRLSPPVFSPPGTWRPARYSRARHRLTARAQRERTGARPAATSQATCRGSTTTDSEPKSDPLSGRTCVECPAPSQPKGTGTTKNKHKTYQILPQTITLGRECHHSLQPSRAQCKSANDSTDIDRMATGLALARSVSPENHGNPGSCLRNLVQTRTIMH